MKTGTDVKFRGLLVGKVSSLQLVGNMVQLGLAIDSSVAGEVPASVSARVVPASAFGTTFVELLSHGPTTAVGLAAGQTVPADASVQTVELQQTLDGIDQVVKALGPAQLAVLLSSLSTALDGHGKDYGNTIANVDHLVRQLAPSMPDFRRDLALLGKNLETLRVVAPNLLDSLDNASQLSDDVVAHQADLAKVLAASGRLADAGSNLIRLVSGGLSDTLAAAAVVSQASFDNRYGLASGLYNFDDLLRRLGTITEGGSQRVNNVLLNASGFALYTKADCPRYGSAAGKNC